MRDVLIRFLDEIRDYLKESGNNLAKDERESAMFVDTFLNISSEDLDESRERIVAKNNDHLKELIEVEIEANGQEANLNHIDVSGITDMSYIFQNSKFNGDISKWTVSNVEDMSGMFFRSSFNGNIDKWKVKDGAASFNTFIMSPLADNPPKWYTK